MSNKEDKVRTINVPLCKEASDALDEMKRATGGLRLTSIVERILMHVSTDLAVEACRDLIEEKEEFKKKRESVKSLLANADPDELERVMEILSGKKKGA